MKKKNIQFYLQIYIRMIRVLAMKCRAQQAYLQVKEKTETSSLLRGD